MQNLRVYNKASASAMTNAIFDACRGNEDRKTAALMGLTITFTRLFADTFSVTVKRDDVLLATAQVDQYDC